MSIKCYEESLLTFDHASVRRELRTIQEIANKPEPYLELEVLHAEPERLRAGMVIYADGTDLDPGSGEGIYRRNADNSAWVFIG